MSITIANNITDTDRYIGDTSTDRVTQADRFNAITEATVWLQEELNNELMNVTYELEYFDTLNYYKVTTAMADLLNGADLRREQSKQTKSFSHKSSREIAEFIGQSSSESAWAIERKDGDSYIVVNHNSSNQAKTIATFDSLTVDGGTWTADTTNSDATNLTQDKVEFENGTGSLNFDIDVSQSGNNKAEVYSTVTSIDIDEYENVSSFIMDVYFKDATNMTSVTLYWGNDDSNYWSATVTTDMDGSAFADGWNKVKVNWADATQTGSVDNTLTDYIQVDINYDGAQTDLTDFRLDGLMLVRPEKLTFHYTSWYVGTDTSGTDITIFGATTDVPYYSGAYDQYRYAVAHKAASLIFYSQLRLRDEAMMEEGRAIQSLDRYKRLFTKSATPEQKTFKVLGVNFRKRRR